MKIFDCCSDKIEPKSVDCGKVVSEIGDNFRTRILTSDVAVNFSPEGLD
ncbi:599_t:CDS:2 [Funneliformis mosseae]|uniref:599_t:CDS:1 n=1 Tax=Funneliformis mosseae TaxID=27381 RepID=A0A9N9GMI1_FUNMO|nr:599_t:CDS:2 [Funneliformis mosseae]